MFKLCQRKITLYGSVLAFENNIYCSIPQFWGFFSIYPAKTNKNVRYKKYS